jgi:all-trans-retinol dehydrogenase (NAD+)
MKPENIARKVTDQLWTCRGGQLIIPSIMSSAPGIRGHPNWIQEIIRDIAVGNAAGKEPIFQWTGR